MPKNNSKILQLDIDTEKSPLLLRSGSILRHSSETSVTIPAKRHMPWTRWRRGLFAMLKVTRGKIAITSSTGNDYLTKVTIAKKQKFIAKLENVVGFSEKMLPQSKWHIDLHAFLTGNFRTFYFEGPGTILLNGQGGIECETVTSASTSYDPGQIIARDGELSEGICTSSSSIAVICNMEEAILSQFQGTGRIYLQSTSSSMPNTQKNTGNFMGFFDFIKNLF